jgi:hypothetical protein
MNGSVIAAATPRKAYEGKIVLDGIGFRHTIRGLLARYDVMLGSLVALGIVIGLVPAGEKRPGVRPSARDLSLTPLIDTLRGLLSGPPSGGPVIMAIAGCAGLLLLGYLWVRAQFTKRA